MWWALLPCETLTMKGRYSPARTIEWSPPTFTVPSILSHHKSEEGDKAASSSQGHLFPGILVAPRFGMLCPHGSFRWEAKQ